MNALRPRRPAGRPAPPPRRPALRRALSAAGLVAMTTWAGCSSAPPTRWHSLLASPTPSSASAGQAAAPRPSLVVQLAPVRVPLAVDQSPWLVRLPDQSLRLLEQERWASPLREELQAALRDQLLRHWGLQEPGPGSAAAMVWRVEVEVQRFESMPGQAAWLGGQFSLAAAAAPGQANRAGLACAFSLRQAVADGPLALAEGHRQGVAQLAALIGQGLQDLAAGRPAQCPG